MYQSIAFYPSIIPRRLPAPLFVEELFLLLGQLVDKREFSTFANAVWFLLKSGKSPCKMHLDIVVPFQNAPAHYAVLKEAEGIYLAILQNYEGDLGQSPPVRIILVKGIRNWTGSLDHLEFINQLGRAIEHASVTNAALDEGVS